MTAVPETPAERRRREIWEKIYGGGWDERMPPDEESVLEIIRDHIWPILYPGIPFPEEGNRYPIDLGIPKPTRPIMNLSPDASGTIHGKVSAGAVYPDDSGTIYGGVEYPAGLPPGGNGGEGGGDVGGVLGGILSTAIGIGNVVANVMLANQLRKMNQQATGSQVIYVNNGNPQPIQQQPEINLPPIDTEKAMRMVHEAYDKLNQTAQEHLNKALDANSQAAKGNTSVMRAIADAAKYSPLPQASQPQNLPPEVYNPQPSSGVGLPNPLVPSKTGANRPFIQEDQAWIQQNLSYAQRPINTMDLARALAESHQRLEAVRQQQQLAQQQMRTLQAQEDLARTQQLALLRQVQSLPPAQKKTPYGEKIDLWQKLQAGEVLTDNEAEHLFHAIDLKKYGGQTQKEKLEAEAADQYAQQQMAKNIVANAETTEEGQIIIQGVPVPEEQAFIAALTDVKHFRETERHLPPDKLLASSEKKLPQQQFTTVEEISAKKIGGILIRDSNNQAVIQVKSLSAEQGLEHYKEGTGIPVRIPFQLLDTSQVKPLQFPEIQEELKNKTPRTVVLKTSPEGSLTLTTEGNQNLLLRNISLRLVGTLTVNKGGTWTFQGKLRAWDDLYDFNSGSRPLIPELQTRIGQLIPGKQYYIQIRGERAIQSSGQLD